MKLLKKFFTNKWIASSFAIASLFGLAYFTVQTFLPADEKKEAVPEIVEEDKQVYLMPSLIVNLSGSEGKRYLKLELAIEYYSEATETITAEFTKNEILLSDRLIMLLSNKTVETIDGFENKRLLKEEIRQKLQGIVFHKIPGSITNIYYKTFLIQ